MTVHVIGVSWEWGVEELFASLDSNEADEKEYSVLTELLGSVVFRHFPTVDPTLDELRALFVSPEGSEVEGDYLRQVFTL